MATRSIMSARTLAKRKNNVLFNSGFEIRPGTITASTNQTVVWIDGSAAGSTALRGYGWAIPSAAINSASAGFDTTIFRSEGGGTCSLRLTTDTNVGFVTAGTYRNASTREYFILQPNQQYTLTGYVRTSNVATNGAFVDLREYGSTGTTLATTSTNKLSGTDTSWRLVTLTVTTNASTRFGTIFLRNNVTGNISDAWFDDLTLVRTDVGRTIATNRTLLYS